MTDEPDGAPAEDGWELAGAVKVARTEQGWAMVGGWDEEGAVGLHLVVHHPEDDELVRRVRVRLPIRARAGELEIGDAEQLP